MKKHRPEALGDAKLRQRFVLIGLTGALPLFLVALLLINVAYSTTIEFGIQEQRGIAFQRLIEGVLQALPRYAIASRRAVEAGSANSEMSTAQRDVDAAMRKLSAGYDGELGRQLGFSEAALRSKGRADAQLGSLQSRWGVLLQVPLTAAAEPERARSLRSLVACLRTMSAHVGDTSNLILDHDLDSYYLADMALRLPQAQARLLEITAVVGTRVGISPPLLDEKQPAVMAALIREGDLARLQHDAESALREDARFHGTSPSLHVSLPAAMAEYTAASQRVLRLLDDLSAGRGVPSAEFEAASLSEHVASAGLFRTIGVELEQLLRTRLDAIGARRASAYSVIVATLLGAAGVMGLLIRGLLAARYAEMFAAQEELRAKEEQLRALGDNLPGGMTYQVLRELDGSMRFLYVSAGVEHLHGVSRTEALADAEQLYALLVEEDRSALLATEQESLASMRPFKCLARSRRRTDGAVRWLEFASAPRRLSDGRVVWDGIQMDVTERQQAEAATRQSQQRFSHIFDNSPIPISLSRLSDGQFIAANESFEKFSGFSRDESLGHSSVDLKLYSDPTQRADVLQRLRTHGRVHGFELAVQTKSGESRTALMWLEVLTIDQDSYVLAMSLDVTEQREAARQQRELEEQLRQAQKLDALGTLAGGIAHDFNNILGAIISYTELSKLDYPDDPLLRQNLDEVLNASQRATALVRQILSFSRQQKEERHRLQLAPIVKEALSLLRATLPTTIAIEQSLDDSPFDVLANPTQIHQIVMNLCTNAAHAMQGKGKVSLAIAQIVVSEGPSKPHVELTPGAYVRLTITDTGHGMDAATAKRIFEPFFTTKRAGEGTGLGLSVVHGIVKEYGGVVTIDSELGRGTSFAIYLPVASGASASPPLEDVEAPRGNGQRILFVDDEPVLGKAAQKMLTRMGYVVTVFRSSVDALAALRSAPSSYAAMITDFTMPDLTGAELIREVLTIRPELRVILASGSSSHLTSDQMRELGVREVLTKPVGYVALGRALHRALAGDSLQRGA